MTFEVIVSPTAGIATAIILLISVTALTFIAVLLLCGIRTEEIKEAEFSTTNTAGKRTRGNS